MKKIEAFIKEEKVEEVTRALRPIEGLTGMTVLRGEGFGRRHEGSELAPTPEMIHDFRQVARVEVFCMDALAETVVAAIEKAAHTGLRHDGKIYVLPVEQAVRVSSGERGEGAI
ncbi:P-II family nitrogen regulator [Alkalilimnicola sp. S0819]|uniref:P-II family nitrogen regulator n=1 Tax=Alkalilimnicola sp. S0819 TaxID=2613922 RepID=UPI0012614C9F|nr:P-II family nitrogen regulator [Alkalilimnicola sp. S0819]KAB7623396.1 P-II family nitrogen regulator [Alkalilimnicola sp. S0819]MPQ16942.1 P-II family nitrogen regulator [Alkalilimnicola sp. S0819]